MHFCYRNNEKQKGQAIVEFALLVPVLLILLCGIIEVGFLISDQLLTMHGSREGARYGAVIVADYEDDYDWMISDYVEQVVPSLKSDRLTVTAIKVNGDIDIKVTVSYNHPYLTPLCTMLFGQDGQMLESQNTMRIE